jgi:hypothetical protein
MARVSDEVLASVCGILAKTEGILPLGDLSTFGDVLRGCALDLRDARAEIVKIKARVKELGQPMMNSLTEAKARKA